MRKNHFGALLFALLISTLAGCQTMSGWTSRLAWWKQDAAASDTSVVARSASPILPSQQATPPAIAGSTSPAASYAAMSTPASPVMGGSPSYAYGAASASTSYPATSTGYPTASYPASLMTSPAGAAPQSQAIASTSAPYAAAPMASANTQQNFAQQGAYNPGGYQAMASQASPARMETLGGQANTQSPASADRYVGAEASAADRYGMAPTSYAAQEPSQSPASNSYTYGASQATASPISTAATASAPQDRYGAAGPSNAGIPAGNVPTTTPPGAWPGSTPYVANASASPSYTTATEIVRLSAPTGQYRPAGTSNYPTANQQYGQVNVATRPETSVTPTANGAPMPQAAYPYESPNSSSQYGTY